MRPASLLTLDWQHHGGGKPASCSGIKCVEYAGCPAGTRFAYAVGTHRDRQIDQQLLSLPGFGPSHFTVFPNCLQTEPGLSVIVEAVIGARNISSA